MPCKGKHRFLGIPSQKHIFALIDAKFFTMSAGDIILTKDANKFK
jgi:hypothetical protein